MLIRNRELSMDNLTLHIFVIHILWSQTMNLIRYTLYAFKQLVVKLPGRPLDKKVVTPKTFRLVSNEMEKSGLGALLFY